MSERQNNRILMWHNGSWIQNTIILSNSSNAWAIFVTDNSDVYMDKWIWNGTNSELVINVHSSCTGLFIDSLNRLYCSSANEHYVFMLGLGPINKTSVPIVVAGTGCPGPVTNMLHHPHGIFVDRSFRLFVVDTDNNRIQRFEADQLHATTVAGFGAPVTFILNRPTYVVLDDDGYLFIVDSGNHRILRSVAIGLECLFGCSGGSEASASHLDRPQTMAFDKEGNIFVTDLNNHRIQKFILIQNSCGTYIYTKSE